MTDAEETDAVQITGHKLAMFEKAILLAELIESDAPNDLIGLTMKMMAFDYLQFCKEVGLDPVHPMDPGKIGLALSETPETMN